LIVIIVLVIAAVAWVALSLMKRWSCCDAVTPLRIEFANALIT